MSVERKTIDTSTIDPKLIDRIPQYLARAHCILPLFATDNQLVVASPQGSEGEDWLDDLRERTDIDIVLYDLVKYSREEIEDAIDDLYRDRSMRIGELLVMNGTISENQLESSLKEQKKSFPKRKIGQVMMSLGFIKEDNLQKAYATQIGYEFLSINATLFIDNNLVQKIPLDLIREHSFLPVHKGENSDEAYLLAADKVSNELLEEVKTHLGLSRVQPVLVVRKELEKAIEGCIKRIGTKKQRDMTLGEQLLERGLITSEQLDEALDEQRHRNVKIGEVLVEKKFVTEQEVFRLVADKLGVEYMAKLPMGIPKEYKSLLTEKFMRFNCVIPVEEEGRELVVVMADPEDKNLLTMLTGALERKIRVVLSSREEITRAINRLFDFSLVEAPGDRIKLDTANLVVSDSEPQDIHNSKRIIDKVSQILKDGILKGASDIHITPNESGADLLFRMDGNLVPVDELSSRDKNPVIARIKILSAMRIDVRHIPQSGRIVARLENRNIDFRVSTLPSQYGENLVMRILDSSRLLGSDLGKLGVPLKVSEPLLEQSQRPQGIILVTGPTGSGKTTTLYHILNWLHQIYPHKSISTIENPIEYVLDGIVQSEVNEARQLTPAAILKEKLRQDPDIIMVGEIRNLEEGGLAFTAALTGHVVFSTLHTNDGASTIRRLVDMGLEPYNIATAVNCILSQRLAKRICSKCATDYTPTEREVELVRKSIPDFEPAEYSLKVGKGCDFCQGGYKGRVGIYELLEVDAMLKQLISENRNDSVIRTSAEENGMKTLRKAGLDVAFSGLTSLQEALAVTDLME